MENLTKERLPGVEIIAVDVGLNTKDQVQAFMDLYAGNPGTKDITFCYEGTDNINIRYEYSSAYTTVYPNTVLTTMPHLYYIDTNNVIKYMTSGKQTLEEIKNNLISYAGYAVDSLNTPNPSSKSFSAIDGETVSATAEGRPKVLVMGGNDYAVRDTLTSYESNFPQGIDLYFINIIGNTREDTISFRETVKADGKIV